MSIALEDIIDSSLSFSMYDPVSDTIVDRSFADYRDKFLILFFYPADFTFVCPTELKDLHLVLDEIRSSGAEVLVVSTDTVYSHKRWIETEMLLA